MASFENILIERDDGVVVLTLNRPERLNAFAGQMREELAEAFREAIEESSIRVIVLTGAGRGFCAGGDVKYMHELHDEPGGKEAMVALVESGRSVIRMIRQTPKPVIAAVNGVAAGGGCNLALACDIRLASEKASFGETFVRIGLHPDWGGLYLLPRLVGPSRAYELMATGRLVEADEAERIGLVHRVVPHEKLLDEAKALAHALADGPQLVLGKIKDHLSRAPFHDLEEALRLEVEAQGELWDSADSREGIAAFVEKREPAFGKTSR